MATTYPSTIQTFSDPAGTSPLSNPDHATLHVTMNDTVEALQNTIGTTAGTNVLKDFSLGQFPVRVNSGGTLVQTVTGGTINAAVIGTSAITGGTITSAVLNVGSDATGDIYYRNSGAYTRLPIGSSGNFLTTNGTVPSWGTVTTSNTALARGYLTAAQENLTDATFVKVNLDTETFDPGNNFATATGRFVAPVTGYYLVTGAVSYSSVIANKRYMVAFYKNGVLYSNASFTSANTDTFNTTHSDIIQLDANAGTIELYARVDAGASTVDLTSGATNTFLNVALITT